ncbi:EthD family reductase [Pedobacter sp. SD-b]|uniref:EthD family reductase n=1 Tax=Pedobacter segetis TaxID=2793069 RepID=A0ABS1BMD8_9SPHI|nr:EthD family reductase [Pedobacter segetis]MBK0383471.1 EthD family reductase [Pedobacter segetis]
MKLKLILPILLLITCLAFSQKKQSGKTKRNSHQGVEKRLIKVSIMYPFAEGKTFDMRYYETKHMPMVAGFLGSNLVKYTVEKGFATGIPNTQLPFMAIGSFYVKSLGDYQAAIEPNRDAIRADFPNYTDVTPVILVSDIVYDPEFNK